MLVVKSPSVLAPVDGRVSAVRQQENVGSADYALWKRNLRFKSRTPTQEKEEGRKEEMTARTTNVHSFIQDTVDGVMEEAEELEVSQALLLHQLIHESRKQLLILTGSFLN